MFFTSLILNCHEPRIKYGRVALLIDSSQQNYSYHIDSCPCSFRNKPYSIHCSCSIKCSASVLKGGTNGAGTIPSNTKLEYRGHCDPPESFHFASSRLKLFSSHCRSPNDILVSETSTHQCLYHIIMFAQRNNSSVCGRSYKDEVSTRYYR